MELINRSAALLIPKEPFVDWVRSVAPNPEEMSALIQETAKEMLQEEELPDEVNDLLDQLSQASAEEDLRMPEDYTVVLLPEVDPMEDPSDYILSHWQDLFEHELRAWCQDETRWPPDRTRDMFDEWFAIDVHTEVLDLVPLDEPVR